MSIFTKIGAFLKTEWDLLTGEIKNVILPIAIAVTNEVKGVIDADQGDLIEAIIQKVAANLPKWEDALRKVLPQIVTEEALAQQFLAQSGNDVNALLALLVNFVNTLPSDQQTLFWTGFAAKVQTALADGKITIIEAFELADYVYHNLPQPTLASITAAVHADVTPTENK